jgi:hypothetical protein
MGALAGAPRVARAPQLRPEPQRERADREPGDEPARRGIAPGDPHRVGADERPRRGAQERRAEAGPQGGARAGGQVQLDPEQQQRDEQALRVADAGEPQEVGRQRERRRGDDPAGHPAAQPPPEAEGEGDPRERARARDRDPEHRRGAGDEREERRQGDRQRLPRRAELRVEIEVQDLASPDEPGPRVVGRRGGREEGQRAEGEAGADEGAEAEARRRGGAAPIGQAERGGAGGHSRAG